MKLAVTGDERALAALIKGYGASAQPERYLLAALCAKHFPGPRHSLAFAAWRRAYKKPRNAWLWYCTYRTDVECGETDVAVSSARESDQLFLRAAVLAALADGGSERAIEIALEALKRVPSREPDKTVCIQSCARTAARLRDHVGDETYQRLLDSLLHHLEAKATAHASRLTIARALSRVVGTRDVHLSADLWRRELRGAESARGPEEPERYARERPEFIGLRGSGKRIAYVVDASDSMLKPLTGAERDDFRKREPVVTGQKGDAKKRRGKSPGLDWSKIKTRFDAARQCVKLSIARLPADAQVVVVLFGTEATLLKSTPGLVDVSRSRIKRIFAELDEVSPTYSARVGESVLRGYTNLHGGLRRAFQAVRKKTVSSPAYVSSKAIRDGCDTLFVLSDGQPTWDDWAEWDVPDPIDRAGDPERGVPGPKHVQKLHFAGAFHFLGPLVDDVDRLNLFRSVEINCVGIGEANFQLLQNLSRRGSGHFAAIGRDG